MVARGSWYCKACHKKAFESQSQAERVMDHIHHLNPYGKTPQRAYQCPYGNGWHLTSQRDRATA